MGEVESVVFGDDWAMQPREATLARGGPDGDVTVGPQTVALVDGRTLDVPALTPGGNLCLGLGHPSQVSAITGEPTASLEDVPRLETAVDWTDPCVIMGQLRNSGSVAWFAVLDTTSFQGRSLADVGEVAAVDLAAGTMTTLDGFEFPLDATESDCGRPLTEGGFMQALADWNTGSVVALVCLYEY